MLSPPPHCSLTVHCEFNCPRGMQFPFTNKAFGARALHGLRQQADCENPPSRYNSVFIDFN